MRVRVRQFVSLPHEEDIVSMMTSTRSFFCKYLWMLLHLAGWVKVEILTDRPDAQDDAVASVPITERAASRDLGCQM